MMNMCCEKIGTSGEFLHLTPRFNSKKRTLCQRKTFGFIIPPIGRVGVGRSRHLGETLNNNIHTVQQGQQGSYVQLCWSFPLSSPPPLVGLYVWGEWGGGGTCFILKWKTNVDNENYYILGSSCNYSLYKVVKYLICLNNCK